MSGSLPQPASFPAHPTRIILTGFMGAGKTTVGALLAERLGWDFFDSDVLVETREAMTIADIFQRRGETAFRDAEAAVIREALACRPGEPFVLAVGGGALERSDTRDFLASLHDTLIVFLEAPLETMIARCAGHECGPVRPVLADRARLVERWNKRLPWYRQAHLTIDTANLAPEAVVERILGDLDRHATASSKAGATA
ncbi:MAG TPA: shikimate kinase [Acidobacteriaceae bacterium]|nr:shikimate kinase [Acidobacteriaceae bacterium]